MVDKCASMSRRKWCPLEYFEDLVDFTVAVEKWHSPQNHLGYDAPHRPDIKSCRVEACTQEDFWCTVPKCNDLQMTSVRPLRQHWRSYFVCIRPHRDPEAPCEPKIGNLEVCIVIDQQVLRFQVPMDNTLCMAENQTRAQLPCKFLKDLQESLRNRLGRAD
jgi:hypothetical protein